MDENDPWVVILFNRLLISALDWSIGGTVRHIRNTVVVARRSAAAQGPTSRNVAFMSQVHDVEVALISERRVLADERLRRPPTNGSHSFAGRLVGRMAIMTSSIERQC